MKRDLQLSQLKTLIAISEEGSFIAASSRLGRTQSAVTQQMQNLEQAVGTPLFVTKGRHRSLTEAGQTLLLHSYEILSLCKQAVSASEHSQSTGVIKLGAPLEIANDLLPSVLQAFVEMWPRVRIVLLIERSEYLMKMLEEGALDLTLSTWRAGSREGERVKMLKVYWIAAKGWQLDPNKPLPLVLTDAPSMYRRICLSALDTDGWSYYEKFTTHSPAGVKFGVEAGLGMTARTKSIFDSDIQILDTKASLPSLPYVSYYLHSSLKEMAPEVGDLYQSIIDRTAKSAHDQLST